MWLVQFLACIEGIREEVCAKHNGFMAGWRRVDTAVYPLLFLLHQACFDSYKCISASSGGKQCQCSCNGEFYKRFRLEAGKCQESYQFAESRVHISVII